MPNVDKRFFHAKRSSALSRRRSKLFDGVLMARNPMNEEIKTRLQDAIHFRTKNRSKNLMASTMKPFFFFQNATKFRKRGFFEADQSS
jgi:hypothetical protein